MEGRRGRTGRPDLLRDPRRPAIHTAVLFLLSVVLLSCVRSETGDGFEVDELYGEGTRVQFRVRVSSRLISTAGDLRLVLETRAAEDWSVSFPDIPDTMGGFQVAERRTEERVLDRDRNLVSRSYTLEPFLPGDYAIPRLEVSFGEQGGSYPFSLSSEEIAIQVVSVLPPQLGEQDIGDIAGPLSLPRRPAPWIGLGAAVLVLGAAAAVLVRRRLLGRSAPPEQPKEPWESAMEELEALLARNLAGRGRYEEFYSGISDLTRRYVERRFGVRAPEQTTEEFLVKAKDHRTLSGYRPLLQDFLNHCDLVKFARYQPSAEEMKETVHACRRFLTETVPGKEGAP